MTRAYSALGPGLRGAFLQDPVLVAGGTMKRAPGPATWSPDGRQIAFFWARDGVNQLWVMPIDGGWPVQLTDLPFHISVDMHTLVERRLVDKPRWSPDGREIAFTARYGDEKDTNLWVIPVAGGEPRRLTKHIGADRSPRWSPDGSQIAFVCFAYGRDDIWIVPAAGGTPLQVTYDRYDDVDPQWSPDCQTILYSSQRSDADLMCNDICTISVHGGEPTVLTNGERVHDRFPCWSRDGKRIFWLSDRSGYDEVWAMTRNGQDMQQITPPTGQDKGEFAISPDEKWLAYESICRCNIDVMVMPLVPQQDEIAGLQTHRVSKNPMGLQPPTMKISPGDGVSTTPAWSPQGDRILFNYANPMTANELWIADLPKGEPRRLTFSMMGNLQGVELAAVEPVSFTSFDGTSIDGLLYRPQEIPAGARYPALLLIHGGPNAQHYNGWWPLLNYLVGKGYVILAPNCRGSNGYGRAFMDANLNDWAGKDMQDWVHAVGFLKSLGYIDAGRIAIWGRSYGGYATVMALTHLPDMFRAGVCHFGPTNMSSMWDQSFVRHLQKRMMGLPVENPALNRERSAVPYAEAVKSPVLILQGGADDGVPPAQSEELVAALQRLGKTYEYYCYEGEGHGFLKLEHVLDAANRIEAFLDKYLKG